MKISNHQSPRDPTGVFPGLASRTEQAHTKVSPVIRRQFGTQKTSTNVPTAQGRYSPERSASAPRTAKVFATGVKLTKGTLAAKRREYMRLTGTEPPGHLPERVRLTTALGGQPGSKGKPTENVSRNQVGIQRLSATRQSSKKGRSVLNNSRMESRVVSRPRGANIVNAQSKVTAYLRDLDEIKTSAQEQSKMVKSQYDPYAFNAFDAAIRNTKEQRQNFLRIKDTLINDKLAFRRLNQ